MRLGEMLASSGPNPDPTTGIYDSIASSGPWAALCLLLLLAGWRIIVLRDKQAEADKAYDRARADKAQAQLEAIMKSNSEVLIPALVQATTLIQKVSDLLPGVVRLVDDQDRKRR